MTSGFSALSSVLGSRELPVDPDIGAIPPIKKNAPDILPKLTLLARSIL